ncbi:MAG TPA: hypothetical protein VIJ96_18605 [Acidothermaceae bacterium]
MTIKGHPRTEYPNVVVLFTSAGRVGDGSAGAAAIADVPAIGAAREGSGDADGNVGVDDGDT